MHSLSTSEIRAQLVSRGYLLLPNRAKVPALHGWNEPKVLARLNRDVTRWDKRFPDAPSTGLAICNGLVVLDFDIDDGPMMDAVFEAIADIVPHLLREAPARYGASDFKVALFAQADKNDEPFTRTASRRYAAQGKQHQIEVFGGKRLKYDKISRQFGILGPHSFNADGSVAAEYAWHPDAPALHEVDAALLPVIRRVEIMKIINAFERLADVVAGWQRVTQPDTSAGSAVYDITDETRFDTNQGGVGLTYAELCEAFDGAGDSLRCSSSFMADRAGTNVERCWVCWSPRHDCVAVWVYGDEAMHFPADLSPDIDRTLLAERLAEIRGQPPTEDEPPEPLDGASLDEKTAWLIDTRAYLEAEDTIVRIHAASLDCRSTPSAFHRRYRAFQRPNPDKRFKRPIYATDLWEASPGRQNVAGVRMRPDRPFPLYPENGRTFKNTYRRPQHPPGGAVAPFMTFMDRFIPDPVERAWLLDWMAHKWSRPDIPGTCILFVADTEDGTREGSFGTGRGLLFKIVHRLYGEAYARAQSFSMLEGTSSQSTFNDWLHGSVLVTVDEARTSPTAYRRGERNAAYEVLKDIVDPAPKLFSFKGKYRQAFDGMSYCSIWVATNHTDALAIPANDRRFTVLRNGPPIGTGEAAAIAAWTDDPANIGALAAALTGRDLSGFNMFEPLATAGKAEMAELARSDVEEMLRDIMEDPARGLVFTKEQIEKVIEHNYNGQGPYWRGEFRAAWHAYCVGLKHPNGGPRRVRAYGTQRKLFTFRQHRKRVDHMPEVAIRREAAKWGGIDPIPGLEEIMGLKEK